MGSKFSKRKHKKGKYKEIEKPLENEEKEKEPSKLIVGDLKCNDFNISKIRLRTRIFSVCKYESKLKIFPNGNILIHDDKDIRIFDPKILKPLFTFLFDKIINVIILSNNSLLLTLLSPNTLISTLQIMNFSKEKTEIIEKNIYIYDGEYFLNSQKLINNIILCYYYERIDSDEKNMYYAPYEGKRPYRYNFIFYRYKNNDLILEYKDSQILTSFEENILPYEDSFFLYGNSSYEYCDIYIDLCFLYFYKIKK